MLRKYTALLHRGLYSANKKTSTKQLNILRRIRPTLLHSRTFTETRNRKDTGQEKWEEPEHPPKQSWMRENIRQPICRPFMLDWEQMCKALNVQGPIFKLSKLALWQFHTWTRCMLSTRPASALPTLPPLTPLYQSFGLVHDFWVSWSI